MESDKKMYNALKHPFSYRKDNLGEIICNDVHAIVEGLKSLNLNQDELNSLKSCYETSYQDSIGSFQVIATLLAIFMGIDLFNDLSISAGIIILLKIILILVWLICICYRIQIQSKESASLRNHIMAVCILQIENNREVKKIDKK